MDTDSICVRHSMIAKRTGIPPDRLLVSTFAARYARNLRADNFSVCTTFESLWPETLGVPYFDFEVYHKMHHGEQSFQQTRVYILDCLSLAFSVQPGFLPENVLFASSHGWVTDKRFEGAVRFKVQAMFVQWQVDARMTLPANSGSNFWCTYLQTHVKLKQKHSSFASIRVLYVFVFGFDNLPSDYLSLGAC